MAWKKSSEALKTSFHEAMEPFDNIQKRQMFGYPCCFVNGNMFTGLHEENWVLRLPEEEREELKRRGGDIFKPLGRLMKEYITLPLSIRNSHDELHDWIARSLSYAAALSPKA